MASLASHGSGAAGEDAPPTIDLLSRVALAKLDEDDREAPRYGLAGAVVHPCGFMRDGLERLVRQRAFENEFRRAIDELFDRRTELFNLVHHIVARQVHGAEGTAVSTVEIKVTQLCRLANQSGSCCESLSMGCN